MIIQVNTEVRKEILESINEYDKLIKEEMLFSVDLRKHDKIVLYTNSIIKLQEALKDGFL